jgi:hypothetical protein
MLSGDVQQTGHSSNLSMTLISTLLLLLLLLLQGVPHELRGWVWWHVSGAGSWKQNAGEGYFARMVEQGSSSKAVKQIELVSADHRKQLFVCVCMRMLVCVSTCSHRQCLTLPCETWGCAAARLLSQLLHVKQIDITEAAPAQRRQGNGGHFLA